jgi:hypothetical protein
MYSSSTSTRHRPWGPAAPTTWAPPGSSTSPTRPSRASSPTYACRSTSRPSTTPPPAIPAPPACSGLRGALLQHPEPRRPEDRRLLVHRLRPAPLRHQRPRPPEGDQLLRGADQRPPGERRAGQRLRDVPAGVRARAPRSVVHRRDERLLRPARRGRRLAAAGRLRVDRPLGIHALLLRVRVDLRRSTKPTVRLRVGIRLRGGRRCGARGSSTRARAASARPRSDAILRGLFECS